MTIETFKGTIKKVEDLTEDIRRYIVELDKDIEFRAGQFVNIEIEDKSQKYMRPYSIVSPQSSKRELEFCIKLVEGGKVTPHLFKKKEGDTMTIKGPFGLFTLDKLQKEKVVLIATGTGIAPFASMVESLIENHAQKEIALVFGTRYDNKIIYKEKFENLEKKNPNFKYLPIISRPTDKWEGRKGYVQNNLDFLDSQNCEIYICGLQTMVEQTKNKLLEMGVSPEFIHIEKY